MTHLLAYLYYSMKTELIDITIFIDMNKLIDISPESNQYLAISKNG